MIISFFSFVSSNNTFAQKYTIKGYVYDSISKKPLPYVNVYLKKHNNIGTITDTNGYFIIRTNFLTDTLCTQYLGYLPKNILLSNQKCQEILFYLQQTTINLSEIVIRPGENPAFRILRAFWANKEKNNPENLEAFQYESYLKTEIKTDNIRPIFLKKNNSDTTNSFKDYSPFLLAETVSDVYYIKNPSRYKEVIKAQKITGTIIDDGELLQNYLSSSVHNYNFYNNWITILEKNFVSPLSETGRMYYKYYLEDSIFFNNKYIYVLRVRPKNEKDLAFFGKIWIYDSTYTIYKLDLQTSPNANINFFKKMHINIQYKNFQEGASIPEITSLSMSLKSENDTNTNVLFNIYQLNTVYVINKPHQQNFYSKFIENADTARNASQKFWTAYYRSRNIDEKALSRSYATIDSARNSPANKFIRNFLKVFLGGYIQVDKFDIGHWVTLYGNNPVEGNRYQLGFKTNNLFSNKLILGAYFAYGQKDEKLKYSLQTEYFFNRKNWTKLGVHYKYDMERLGIDADYLQDYQFLNILFSLSNQFGSLNKLSLSNSFRCWFESDLGRNFNHKIEFSQKNFVPQGNFSFAYYDEKKNIQDKYNISEITYNLRWAPNEIKMVKGNIRIMPEQLKYPVVNLRFSFSSKNVFNSDFTYQKITLSVRQFLLLGPLGKLRYQFTANKVFGTVPYSLLNIFQGNNSFMSSMRSYNMMKFSEFVADQSLELMVINDFQGIIFNRIFFLSKLKWRELAGVNAIWGNFSESNKNIIPLYDTHNRPLTSIKFIDKKTPYVEVCYGIGNIFKCMRIIAFHRLNYIYEDTDKFGLRLSFYLSL